MAVKKIIGLAVGAIALTSVAAKFAVTRRPSMPQSIDVYAPPATESVDGELRVTFFGVSTLAITDGETTIITDGFLSRPSLLDVVARRISSDSSLIDRELRRGGVDKAAAVFVAHSHYDHALDAPAVAWRTGALLVGSDSTLNIGRGYGLAEDRMRLADTENAMTFGKFNIECILSDHSPQPKFRGFITEPLHAPAPAREYRMAECYSFLISHTNSSGKTRRMLIHASAGFVPGCLEGRKADVAFLGLAPIGRQPAEYRDAYWRETVQTVEARRVFPIHWDDFTLPLDRPLVPLPYFADDFGKTWDFLMQRQAHEGVEVLIPEPFVTIDPFSDF